MWKNISNLFAAASDMVVIGSKEVAYQAGKASNATASVTGTISSKAAAFDTAGNMFTRFLNLG